MLSQKVVSYRLPDIGELRSYQNLFITGGHSYHEVTLITAILMTSREIHLNSELYNQLNFGGLLYHRFFELTLRFFLSVLVLAHFPNLGITLC